MSLYYASLSRQRVGGSSPPRVGKGGALSTCRSARADPAPAEGGALRILGTSQQGRRMAASALRRVFSARLDSLLDRRSSSQRGGSLGVNP